MDLISGIAAASEGLKLLRDLRAIDNKFDQAELKIRLAELADKLLEAKEALQDAKSERTELIQRISDLEKAKNTRFLGGKLYEIDQNGQMCGDPYCALCFQREEKYINLMPGDYMVGNFICLNCNNVYD